MSEKATITAMREWLKTCPLIAEEQSENGAAFRISGLSPEPVAEFSIEDSPTDPVTAVFFSGRNLAKSYIFVSRRDYSEAQSVQIANSFCFIKKYKSSIHFNKTDLLGVLHFFRGTSKTVFISQNQLLHHCLHLGIKGM